MFDLSDYGVRIRTFCSNVPSCILAAMVYVMYILSNEASFALAEFTCFLIWYDIFQDRAIIYDIRRRWRM